MATIRLPTTYCRVQRVTEFMVVLPDVVVEVPLCSS
jgi:hypothetical protein